MEEVPSLQISCGKDWWLFTYDLQVSFALHCHVIFDIYNRIWNLWDKMIILYYGDKIPISFFLMWQDSKLILFDNYRFTLLVEQIETNIIM